MKQGKVWGINRPLLVTGAVEMNQIHIKCGGYCSRHYHEHKNNAFYVISGELHVYIEKKNYDLTDLTKLHEGDITIVEPGEVHWFEAMRDTEALELYYLSPISEDIKRENCGGVR